MSLKRKRIWMGVIAFGVVLLMLGVVTVQTSTDEFCMSCHEMKVYKEELQASSHAKDADGKPITCAQCHIPGGNIVRMLAVKSYLGVGDIWAHYTGEPYNLDRARMQVVARRFTDDSNCRACHQDLERNAKNDGPVSIEGKLAHDAYLGKNGQSRNGCAGCHTNMAHLPVFDQRIPKNAEFLAKLKENAKLKESQE